MRRSLLAFLMPLRLMAGGWDPIPPEAWAIKPESTRTSSGAIFLTDFTRYGVNDTESRLRILVLSEAGKAAVQLEPFPSSPILEEVEGRVVYPDGHETAFNKAQDFSDQIIKVGTDETTRKVIIPPGLTDHCIVDLHWTLRSDFSWFSTFDRWIQRAYPIQNLEIRLSNRCPLASAWLRPNNIMMESAEDEDYKIYRFKNLPALEPEPYSYEAWLFRPKLMCFEQPRMLREAEGKRVDLYWQTVAQKEIKAYYLDSIKYGRKYRALAIEVMSGLPADPVQKAEQIEDRLYARILNINAMTAAEKVARTKGDEKAHVDSEDLNETADRKWTDEDGMFDLAFRVFLEAGLQPKILLVADRSKRGFRYELPDFFQFGSRLLGVETADAKGIVWFDPTLRFIPEGIIRAQFQGTKGLVFDTKDWSVHPYQVPVQPAGVTSVSYQYQVSPGEDSDVFKLQAHFTGQEEWIERTQYYDETDAEARKQLKKNFEASKQLTVTRTALFNATDRSKPFSWEVEGSREIEGGRRRQVNPFPGLDCPVWVPSEWPDHRVDPVVMKYTTANRYTSRIVIPAGWKAELPAAMEKTNQFGKVSWQCQQIQDSEGGRAVAVSYEVTISNLFGPPASEGDLRDFLSWVQSAWSQRIGLEKVQ